MQRIRIISLLFGGLLLAGMLAMPGGTLTAQEGPLPPVVEITPENAADLQPVYVYGDGESLLVRDMTFFPQKRQMALLTTELDAELPEFQIIDLVSGAVIQRFNLDVAPACVYSGDNCDFFLGFNAEETVMVTSARNAVITLWDIENGGKITDISYPAIVNERSLVQFHRPTMRLFIASEPEDRLVVLDVLANTVLLDVPLPGDPAAYPPGLETAWGAMSISPDGNLVAVTDADWDLHLWNVESGAEEYEIDLPDGWTPPEVQFNPAGTELYVVFFSLAEDANLEAVNQIYGWDLTTNTPLEPLPPFFEEEPIFNDLVFSPDGRLMVAESVWTQVGIYDMEQRELAAVLDESVIQGSHSVHFNPASTLFAIGGGTNPVVNVWDAASLTMLFETAVPGATVNMGFSPDGLLLATLDLNGTLTLWGVPEA